MTARPLHFVGAETDYERARVVILGIPLERTVSYRGGPAQAPTAIRAVSDSVETYSAIFRRDLAGLAVCDLGDLDCTDTLEDVLNNAQRTVTELLREGKRTVLLGGEHTITLAAVRAAVEVRGTLQLVAIDAHTDLRDTYNGAKLSHATVLRRSLETTGRLVILGARSFYGGEVDEPWFASVAQLPSRLEPGVPVWLTIDLDGLDPSLCPGVTNPEPGGLAYRELIEVFRTLQGRDVVGLDVVELAPPFDPSGVTAVCAAKLIIEAACALW